MGEFKNKKEIFGYLWEKIKLAFVLKDGTKVLSSNDYTTSEKSKLDGIEEGAQKNVQADWDATSGDTLILNKPSIPTALSELANDSGYIVGDLSQLETSEKESVILAINELLEKINSLKGGGGTTGGLTYSKVTLENGSTIWKGSDNKYYTDKTSEILVSPGSYTLSTGKILTIYSDGTGILSDPQPEGGDSDDLVYIELTLMAGAKWYQGSDNKIYTSNNGSHILVSAGEYELSDGRILTVDSNGIGTIADAPTPETYIELEYLTIPAGNWNQSNWFDTGITTFCKDTKLTMTKYRPASVENFCLMGTGSDSGTFFGIQDGKVNINGVKSSTELMEAGVLYNNVVFNLLHNDDATFSIDGQLLHTAPDNWNGQQGSLKSKAFDGARGMTGDFYELIWEQENNIVSDMIPVIRSSDSVVCFYDKIRDIYILPEEGTWTAGPVKGSIPSTPAKKMTTWSEDFSDGIGMVENDENGWYDLSASSGRLSAILREPDTTAKLACFIINTPSPLDLSDGAYMQIDIQGILGGTATVSSSWNDYSCFAMRLRDSSGAYTGWVEIDANGIGNASKGIGDPDNNVTMTSRTNIASYLGTSADLSNIVAAEITLIGWPSTTISYKAMDKGVYIDNLVISRSATETPEEGAASGGSTSGTSDFDILEYLYIEDEESNTASFKTGVAPSNGNIDVNMKITFDKDMTFYGFEGFEDEGQFIGYAWGGVWFNNETRQDAYKTLGEDAIIRYRIASGKAYVTVNGKDLTTASITTPTGGFIIGEPTYANTQNPVGKIYYVKISYGDTLVADMIPVKKKDGTICFYDRARNIYIYKTNSGSITAGPVIGSGNETPTDVNYR